MSIKLPNNFECVSRTLVFDGSIAVDFLPLAQHGIPDELARQLETTRFLVTLSDVVSTSCGNHHTFRFREALLKIPVIVRDREFLFPVAGFVDHEYSLARGYLLGFNKFFMNRPAVPFTLSQDGLELDVRASPLNKPSTTRTFPRSRHSRCSCGATTLWALPTGADTGR